MIPKWAYPRVAGARISTHHYGYPLYKKFTSFHHCLNKVKIRQQSRRVENGRVRLSALIQLEKGIANIPRDSLLWFDFPEEYAPYLTERGDGFVVAMLFVAMRSGENIHVEGRLSSQLEHGLREYQHVFTSWFRHLHPVEITCNGYEHSAHEGTTGVTGCFFSGGVDSFFTLWSHLYEREPNPDYRITHGVFIHGFDADVLEPAPFESSLARYQTLFDELQLKLIPVRTNLKTYINDRTTGWRAAHGAFLISIPLLLGGLFDRFYVPSSDPYSADHPSGTHSLVDHLLSTESLEIIHDGAWAPRAQKTAIISTWPATYDRLYVCFVRQGDGLHNCCRCEKCIRTMIALEIAGTLNKYTTFPLPLNHRDIRGWRMPYYYATGVYADELLDYAKHEGRDDIAGDLRHMILNHRIRNSQVGKGLRKLFVLPVKKSPALTHLYRALRSAR